MLFPDLGDALTPYRRHPGQRGVMACQPHPRQRSWLQRASRQLQGQGRRERKMLNLSMCAAHGGCSEVWCRPFPTNLPSPIHHCLTPAQRHAQCNNVTLGGRLPIQPSAVGNRSLMWPYHTTGTTECSTPLCSVPQHCTQGR